MLIWLIFVTIRPRVISSNTHTHRDTHIYIYNAFCVPNIYVVIYFLNQRAEIAENLAGDMAVSEQREYIWFKLIQFILSFLSLFLIPIWDLNFAISRPFTDAPLPHLCCHDKPLLCADYIPIDMNVFGEANWISLSPGLVPWSRWPRQV